MSGPFASGGRRLGGGRSPTVLGGSRRGSLDSGAPALNALTYGADASGAADSTSAIQAAINALPASGGVVYLPAGNYRVNGVLSIGNGSASAWSSRNGVVLQGAAPVGTPEGADMGSPPPATRLFSGAGTTLVQVLGPLQGWGLRDLVLDGALLGSRGLEITAGQGGDCQNLIFKDFTLAGVFAQARPATGGLAGTVPNSMHNSFKNIEVRVPDLTTVGVQMTGNNTDGTSNTCYDLWDNLTIRFAALSGGHQSFGIYLQVVDNIVFRHTHIIGYSAGVTAIMFDYTGVLTNCPSDCKFIDIDLGHANTVVTNGGGPVGATPNIISDISQCNGRPADPSLPNLIWGSGGELTRSKAGNPVVADMPAGTWGVWKNTTSGATALWVNDGGVMKSVALT